MTAQSTNRQAENRIKKFHEEQRSLRAALMVTGIVLDEGKITLESLASLYGLNSKAVKMAIRVAYEMELVNIVDGEPGGPEVFVATKRGWRLSVLTWIGRHGVATEEFIKERFRIASDSDLALRFVEQGVKNGVLRNAGVMRSEPELVVATRNGLAQVGLSLLGVCQVSDRIEGHLRTVAMKAIRLELRHGRTHRVMSEREIHLLHRGKKRGGTLGEEGGEDLDEAIANPVYHIDEKTGKVNRKRSDLLMQPRNERTHQWVPIEVELSKSRDGEVEKQTDAWRDCDTVGPVIYYNAPEVNDQVESAIAESLRGYPGDPDLELIEAGDERPNEQERLAPRYKITSYLLHADEVPSERRKVDYALRPIPCAGEYFHTLGQEPLNNIRGALLAIVEWIGWHGFTPVDAIAARFGYSEADACHLLTLAHGAGWLDFTTMLREEGALFQLSLGGRRKLGVPLPPTQPTLYSSVARQAMCSRVAALLECKYPDRFAKGLVEVRTDYQVGGEKMLRVAEVGSALGERKNPDMMLVSRRDPAALPYAIVLEPSTMQVDRVFKIIAAYGSSDRIERAFYYASYESMLVAAEAAVRELDLGKKVKVFPLPLSRDARARLSRTREPEPPKSRKAPTPKVDCRAQSHEPLDLVGEQFKGVTAKTWEQLCEEFPNLQCGPKRRRGVCDRSTLNGILYVLGSDRAWTDLPREFGYGAGVTCSQKLAKMQASGAWSRAREVITLNEPDRLVDWERAATGKRRTRKPGGGRKPRSFALVVTNWDPATGQQLVVTRGPGPEITDQTWSELRQISQLNSCMNYGRGRVCDRMVLNGVLQVLAPTGVWEMLTSDLGYGVGTLCKSRMRGWQRSGAWDLIQEIVTRCEPDRDIDWERAQPAGRSSHNSAKREITTHPSIGEELWKILEPLFAETEFADPATLSNRVALDGALCILLNEVPWKALDGESRYGSREGRRVRMREWLQRGVWPAVQAELVQHEPYNQITQQQWQRLPELAGIRSRMERTPRRVPKPFVLPVTEWPADDASAIPFTTAPMKEISDRTWSELVRGRHLGSCKQSRRKGVCERMALNGVLYALSAGQTWQKLTSDLGYGSEVACKARLRKWQEDGVWDSIQAIIKENESSREIDWQRADIRGRWGRYNRGRTIATFPNVDDGLWRELEPLFAGPASPTNASALGNRVVLDAILCILLNEVSWKALAAESGYGDHAGRRERVRKWAAAGAWRAVQAELIKHEPYSQIKPEQWDRVTQLAGYM